MDRRQMRLAQIDIDIDRKSPKCTTILSSIQSFAQQRPDLQSLDFMFKPGQAKQKQPKI